MIEKGIILTIPVDQEGNKLFIKNVGMMNDQYFCDYKCTYNDIPFQRTELILTDHLTNLAICADNGTVLYRFPKGCLDIFFKK